MAEEQAQTPTRQLLLQKIYVKDLSFESPKAPEIFTGNITPQTQLNIRSDSRRVDDQNMEVTLTLTVESKHNGETLFLIEIVQAGVFMMVGYSDQEMSMLVGSFCPSTLFPFAREAIADIASKGGFPPMLLQPINFDALYAQALQKRTEEEQAANAAAAAAPAGIAPTDPPAGSGETH